MAILLLARSTRLVRHAACVSFSRCQNPASTSSLSTVTSFEIDFKRQYIFSYIRHLSASAFARKVDIQEKNVLPDSSNMASFNGQQAIIEGDIMHGDSNVEDSTAAATFQSNKGTKCNDVDDQMGMIDGTFDGIVGAQDVDSAQPSGNVDVIVDSTQLSGNVDVIVDAQDVDSTQPSENSLSTLERNLAENEIPTRDCVDDTSLWVVMHVTHLLGIIEHDNLVALKSLPGSPDEIFSNLSFLMTIGFTENQLIDTISMHPVLMTMDLNKSLSRVMRCLKKVELDESFLKQVLVKQPGLVPLLAKRTLQERVKALRDLEFPDEDIGALLKRIGTNQLDQFLSLPVEKIEPTYKYITDKIGLRNSEAMKLISSFPSVLLRDAEDDYASKLKVLKQVFEELKRAKKVLMNLPELLARKTEALDETVLCLKEMVKDVKKLSSMIEVNPSILTHRKSGIEQVSVFLQSLGFDSKSSVALIAREPYLVECGSDRLKKHVEFLKSKGLDENAIRGLLESSTGMFFRSLEKRVAPKFDFLENQGITGESLQKYMKARPQVCDRPLRKSMNPNLDFLLSLGFEKNSSSLTSALKVILPYTHKGLQARVNHIISLGIDKADVHKMVREEPSILVIPDASLKKRVDFLLKVMKRPLQDLVQCPSFLTSSINRVLMPRLKVFEWLSSKGLLRKFSLSTLVETDETVFVKKYVQAFPEALSIYRGSPQGSS